jgi:hypothetical protein
VVALHAVQFVQVFWLVAVENFPVEHATQVRSVVAVPLAAIFCPATQLDHAVQKNALAAVEYFPVLQGVHNRSALLVPFVEMRWPLVQFLHDRQLCRFHKELYVPQEHVSQV